MTESSNTDVIGNDFPQCTKMTKGYDYDAPNSVHKLDRHRRSFPDFTPNLHSFVLNRTAKLTDIVSAAVISGCGFLVSEKVKSIVERFETIPVKFYQAKLIHRQKSYDYYWMHLVSHDFSQLIDYPRSEFEAVYLGTQLETFQVNSFDELLMKKAEFVQLQHGSYVDVRGLSLRINKSIAKYSILSLLGFDFRFHLRQDLKEEFLNNNCSGLDLVRSSFTLF